jgi:hypothetical protein
MRARDYRRSVTFPETAASLKCIGFKTTPRELADTETQIGVLLRINCTHGVTGMYGPRGDDPGASDAQCPLRFSLEETSETIRTTRSPRFWITANSVFLRPLRVCSWSIRIGTVNCTELTRMIRAAASDVRREGSRVHWVTSLEIRACNVDSRQYCRGRLRSSGVARRSGPSAQIASRRCARHH